MKNYLVLKVNETPLKIFTVVIPFFLCMCLFFLAKTNYPIYCAVISDDTVLSKGSIIEHGTALFYILSSVYTFIMAISFFKNRSPLLGYLHLFLSLLLFIFCGEELSWGQRYFGIATSGIFAEHNLQHEDNFHNMDIFTGMAKWFYILQGLYGGFMWIISKPIRKKIGKLTSNYIIPKWYLMTFFLTGAAYFIYLPWILPVNNFLHLSWREQEPAECILTMGIFIFFLINRYRQIQEFKLQDSQFLVIKSVKASTDI